jgi:hypothetical protein
VGFTAWIFRFPLAMPRTLRSPARIAARVMASATDAVSTAARRSLPRALGPAEELQTTLRQLLALHDKGVISRQQYDELIYTARKSRQSMHRRRHRLW